MTSGYAHPARIHGRLAHLEREVVELIVHTATGDPLTGWRMNHLLGVGQEIAELRRVHEGIRTAAGQAASVSPEQLSLEWPRSTGTGEFVPQRDDTGCRMCNCPCGPPL